MGFDHNDYYKYKKYKKLYKNIKLKGGAGEAPSIQIFSWNCMCSGLKSKVNKPPLRNQPKEVQRTTINGHLIKVLQFLKGLLVDNYDTSPDVVCLQEFDWRDFDNDVIDAWRDDIKNAIEASFYMIFNPITHGLIIFVKKSIINHLSASPLEFIYGGDGNYENKFPTYDNRYYNTNYNLADGNRLTIKYLSYSNMYINGNNEDGTPKYYNNYDNSEVLNSPVKRMGGYLDDYSAKPIPLWVYFTHTSGRNICIYNFHNLLNALNDPADPDPIFLEKYSIHNTIPTIPEEDIRIYTGDLNINCNDIPEPANLQAQYIGNNKNIDIIRVVSDINIRGVKDERLDIPGDGNRVERNLTTLAIRNGWEDHIKSLSDHNPLILHIVLPLEA